MEKHRKRGLFKEILMDNFTFYSPTKFVFGKDTENNAGALVKEFGGNKVLLHFGGKSAEKSGLLGRVRDSLKGAGVDFVELNANKYFKTNNK